MRSRNPNNSVVWRLIGLGSLFFYGTFAIADWHAELSLRSEYVYRGYSKNRGNPVVQADLHYQGETGWFLGTGLSQVSFDDHANPDYAELEVKPYFGWNIPLITDWRADLSVSGYVYNDKVFSKDVDYAEFSAALHYRDWLSGRVFFAPDAYQKHVSIPTYELNLRHDLLDTLQFSAGAGYSEAKALLRQDYFYWNAGFSWFLTGYVAVDVRYVDVLLEDYPVIGRFQQRFYPRPLENKYLLSLTVGF